MGSSKGLRLNDAQVDAIHAIITGGGTLPQGDAAASSAVLQAVAANPNPHPIPYPSPHPNPNLNPSPSRVAGGRSYP